MFYNLLSSVLLVCISGSPLLSHDIKMANTDILNTGQIVYTYLDNPVRSNSSINYSLITNNLLQGFTTPLLYENSGLTCINCNNNVNNAFGPANDISVYGYGARDLPLFNGTSFVIDYPGFDKNLSFKLTMDNFIVSNVSTTSSKSNYNSYNIPIYYASSAGSIPYILRNDIMDYGISNAGPNMVISNSIPSSSIKFSTFTQFKNSHYLAFRGISAFNSGLLPTASFDFDFTSSITNLYSSIVNGSISDLVVNLSFNAYVFYAKGKYFDSPGSPTNGVIPDYISLSNDNSFNYSIFVVKDITSVSGGIFYAIEPVHFNFSFILSNFVNDYDNHFSISANFYDFLSSYPVLNTDYNIIMDVILTDNFNFSVMPSNSLGGSFDTGYNVGYTDGYNTGNQDGYNSGYKIGFNEGSVVNPDNSFSSLFFSLLNTPFLILKEGFNFELFGINFYSLIMTIITIAIVVFVVRFLKGHMGGDS